MDAYMRGHWDGMEGKKFYYPESSSYPLSIRRAFWFMNSDDPWMAGRNSGFIDANYFGYVRGYRSGHDIWMLFDDTGILYDYPDINRNNYDPVSPTLPFNPFKYLFD